MIKKEASSGSVKKRKFILPDPTEIVGQPRMIPPPVDLEALPPSIDSGVRMFTDIMSPLEPVRPPKRKFHISYRSYVVKPKRTPKQQTCKTLPNKTVFAKVKILLKQARLPRFH